MLATIGVGSVEDLFVDVPASARLAGPVDLPRQASEAAVERTLSAWAARNRAAGAANTGPGPGGKDESFSASLEATFRDALVAFQVPAASGPSSQAPVEDCFRARNTSRECPARARGSSRDHHPGCHRRRVCRGLCHARGPGCCPAPARSGRKPGSKQVFRQPSILLASFFSPWELRSYASH